MTRLPEYGYDGADIDVPKRKKKDGVELVDCSHRLRSDRKKKRTLPEQRNVFAKRADRAP